MGLLFEILAMALAVATCGMSVRYGERWRNIGLLIWMVVMEVSICLTLYVHELFISIIIGTAIVLVIMVFTIELVMKKKNYRNIFSFCGNTLHFDNNVSSWLFTGSTA